MSTGPRRKPDPNPVRRLLGTIAESLLIIAVALSLSLLIKTYVVQAFSIPSGSMEDTLLIGDRILVSKLGDADGPRRGDVVVFTDPGGWLPPQPTETGTLGKALRTGLTAVGLRPEDYGKHLVKRVIGLPGETVMCCDAAGRITVNGASLNEPYVRAGNRPSEIAFSVTVGPDQLWVMGDNREQSEDSRRHRTANDGQVPESVVVGKAVLVAWPISRWGSIGSS